MQTLALLLFFGEQNTKTKDYFFSATHHRLFLSPFFHQISLTYTHSTQVFKLFFHTAGIHIHTPWGRRRPSLLDKAALLNLEKLQTSAVFIGACTQIVVVLMARLSILCTHSIHKGKFEKRQKVTKAGDTQCIRNILVWMACVSAQV